MQPAPPGTAIPAVTAPRPGCLLLGIPVLAVVATFAAYAWLVWTGLGGRPATGDHVRVTYRACPEARSVVAERLSQMGLPDVRFEDRADGFAVALTLPAEPEVAAEIPLTLARPGRLEVRDLGARPDDPPLLDHTAVVSSSVRLDLTMTPTTLVVLERAEALRLFAHLKAAPEGRFTIHLDGERVAEWSNLKSLGEGELEIPPDAADDKARMRLAAARSVVLGAGPLPCPTELVGVEPLARPDRRHDPQISR